MEDFMIITDFKGGQNIEVDVEDDGMLTMTSIQSQFGKDANGLKCKNPATGNWRQGLTGTTCTYFSLKDDGQCAPISSKGRSPAAVLLKC